MTERSDIGGDRHPAEHERTAGNESMQVVSGTRPAECAVGARSAPPGARDGFRNHQILGRRDLDIRRLALDQPDAMSGPLGERRFVGGIDAQREGFAQHLTAECLRCLREKDRLTRERLCHHHLAIRHAAGGQWCASLVASVPENELGALDRIARGHRRQGGPRFRRRRNGPRNDIRDDERADRVVNHHDLGPPARRVERVRHRVLAARAAGDNLQRLRRVPQVAGRVADELVRDRDDHLVHRRMIEKGRHAALEDRPATDHEQLLRRAGAESRAASARGNDRRHERHSAQFIPAGDRPRRPATAFNPSVLDPGHDDQRRTRGTRREFRCCSASSAVSALIVVSCGGLG